MEKEQKVIDSFRGQYRFLSNFWPVSFKVSGIRYPSVEHAYQAYKTYDKTLRRKVAELPTPGKAKNFWKENENSNPVLSFDQMKTSLMNSLIYNKFSFENEIMLIKLLVDTNDFDLIEGNNWGDKFWGMEKENGVWVGENNLGLILMKRRQNFIEQKNKLNDLINLNPKIENIKLANKLGISEKSLFLQKIAFGIK